jgi:hypothetical protein
MDHTKNYEEHKAEAEAFLSRADGIEDGPRADELERYYLAAAQVHATLALAAATRANRTVTVREDRP